MRKMILLSVAGALVLGLGVPAHARDNPRAAREAAQAQGADAGDPERTICIRTQMTGSRLMRRVCRTAREWVEQDGGLPEGR